MPHPFEYTQVSVVSTIPPNCRDDWAKVVVKRFNALSDAVEADNAPDIAHALDLFLRMTDALVKPKRGGFYGAKKTRSAISRELSLDTVGTFKPSILYGKDRYVPTDAESRRVARAHDLVK